jgi:hypothetical protein
MDDLISRKALCDYALNQKDKSITPNDIMRFPSAQLEQKYIDPCDTCQYNSLDWHEEPCESCTVVGYLGSLENALFLIRRLMIRDGLENADTDLVGALRTVRQITDEFERTMKRVLGED